MYPLLTSDKTFRLLKLVLSIKEMLSSLSNQIQPPSMDTISIKDPGALLLIKLEAITFLSQERNLILIMLLFLIPKELMILILLQSKLLQDMITSIRFWIVITLISEEKKN